jgi:hypothetical protein
MGLSRRVAGREVTDLAASPSDSARLERNQSQLLATLEATATLPDRSAMWAMLRGRSGSAGSRATPPPYGGGGRLRRGQPAAPKTLISSHAKRRAIGARQTVAKSGTPRPGAAVHQIWFPCPGSGPVSRLTSGNRSHSRGGGFSCRHSAETTLPNTNAGGRTCVRL